MTISQIDKFAKEQGYDGIEPLGKWHGYDAFEPVYDGDVAYVGPPLMILAKGNEIRMSTPEEGYQQIDGK